MSELIKCDVCGEEILRDDSFTHAGKTLCEDCYIDVKMELKACDPMGVRSAKIIEEMTGKSGEESLTNEQKEIYNYIKSHEGAKKNELADTFEMNEKEIENIFAILRRFELVKAEKRNEEIYLVPFN
ncbi:MAG: hypothetical protein BAJALOKI3v1_620026 [Promethearchaeota archaeon]|jgi:hypothetical protein|nr:MAG: hypothetical protein BAJALOKI3v1_620026 [Candidatus Lokiarchaeota archaeon]